MAAETSAESLSAQWQAIVDANNQRPPMWLRVNRNHHPAMSGWLLEEAGMKVYPS
jgi:16S rRNA (cytosine967-C5)-methyltransferase